MRRDGRRDLPDTDGEASAASRAYSDRSRSGRPRCLITSRLALLAGPWSIRQDDSRPRPRGRNLKPSTRMSIGRAVAAGSLALAHVLVGAAAARRRSHRGDCDSPHGGPALHREADQAPRNLRRPGRDRHRERAADFKNCRSAIADLTRGAGAADRDE